MPTTSDGRQFPYTADGIRAAEAHERSLKQERRRMGKQSDKTTGDPFSTMRPSGQKRNPIYRPPVPDESYKGYRGGGAAPKVPPRKKSAEDVRLIQTNDPTLRDTQDMIGEYGSEGMLYGKSAYERSITSDGIKNERRLRRKIKLPR